MSTPNLSFTQSSDGKKITFTDETTYTSPIANYTRVVEIWSSKDAGGTLITTLAFTGTALTVDYNITRDAYISAKLVFTGSPSIASKTINFLPTRFEYNKLVDKQKVNCGCTKRACNPTFDGFIYLYLAQQATQYGNSGLANDFISASSTLLSK